MRYRVLTAVALATLMALSIGLTAADARTGQAQPEQTVAPASAAFQWSLTHVLCYTSGGTYGWGGISGQAYIRENGVSGTTWFRLTGRFQRRVGGVWRTTQTKHIQSSHQFANNSNWHSLTWKPSGLQFSSTHSDFTHFTRLFVLFEWFDGNSRIFWATRWSGAC